MISFLKRLWHKEPRAPLNLLAPDLIAEVVIHLGANGERRMFVSNLPPGTTVDVIGTIVMAIVQSAADYGAKYGIELNMQEHKR